MIHKVQTTARMGQSKKILIVRFSSLGDVLLTTPLIRALKKRFPDAAIDYFTKPAFAPILEANPYLRRVIELPGSGKFADLRAAVARMKRKGGYDILLDLHGNPRSWYVRRAGLANARGRAGKNRVKRFLLLHLGVNLYGPNPAPMAERYFTAMDGIIEPPLEPDDRGAEIFLTDADRAEAASAVGDFGRYIVIAPSAFWPTKRWPPERFAMTGDILSERLGAKAVLVGAGRDRRLAEDVARFSSREPVNLAGKLSIRGCCAAIEKAAAFVGNDTGLMHIAGALGTAGAAVFGPTTRHLGFFPYKSPVKVVERIGLDCRPCTKQGRNRCPKGHFRCMTEIGVEEVVEAVLDAKGA